MVTFKTQIINSKQNHSNHTIPSLANKFLKSVKTKIHLRYKHSTKSIKNQKQYTYIKVKTKNNYQQSQTLIPTKKKSNFFQFPSFLQSIKPIDPMQTHQPTKKSLFSLKIKKDSNFTPTHNSKSKTHISKTPKNKITNTNQLKNN